MIHILVGKSASGKDTMLKQLFVGHEMFDVTIDNVMFFDTDRRKQLMTGHELFAGPTLKEYNVIVTCTNRPMRDGELDGFSYKFKTKEEMEQLIKENKLFEWREYHTLVDNIPDTWYYGTEKMDIDDAIKNDYVAVVDIGGALAYINYFGKENCCVYYVAVCDYERTRRAKSRAGYNETEWLRRVKDDNIKFSEENLQKLAKAVDGKLFIINNSLYKRVSDNLDKLVVDKLEKMKDR